MIDLKMTPFRLRLPILGLLPAIALTACSGATAGIVQVAPAPAIRVQSSPEAIARAQADSIRLGWVAGDANFMAGMISHHAQAIAMSHWVPTHGTAAIHTLAARIINAQTDEIVIMQQWLSDRRQPIPEPNPRGMAMMMNGMQHEMLMPGMLTEAQMQQLDRARGADFDRLFLTFMIQHHNGAVSMVKELFNTYGAGQNEVVFKFASDVNVDQTTEIARMERMLAAMAPAKPAP